MSFHSYCMETSISSWCVRWWRGSSSNISTWLTPDDRHPYVLTPSKKMNKMTRNTPRYMRSAASQSCWCWFTVNAAGKNNAQASTVNFAWKISMPWMLCTPHLELSPSVLWHCWLGDRKGIWPVESWVLVCWWWQSDWSFAQFIATVVTNISIILKLQ